MDSPEDSFKYVSNYFIVQTLFGHEAGRRKNYGLKNNFILHDVPVCSFFLLGQITKMKLFALFQRTGPGLLYFLKIRILKILSKNTGP